MRKISIESRAKLNLFLKVYGTRPDGFHNIHSIFQTIDLADVLIFSLEKGRSGITIRTKDNDLPIGDDNLVVKAYRRLAKIKEPSPGEGILCEIIKKIPIGSGMGGGSSNCASALFALNTLLGIGLDEKSLSKLGAELGSDVPFFFTGGTCFVHGRGELLEMLPDISKGGLLIASPPISVDTAEAYKLLDEFRRIRNIDVLEIPDEDEMFEIWNSAILNGGFEVYMHNDFEELIFEHYPEIAETRRLLQQVSNTVYMTGSGSALFAYFSDYQDAWKALDIFKKSGDVRLVIARPVTGGYVVNG